VQIETYYKEEDRMALKRGWDSFIINYQIRFLRIIWTVNQRALRIGTWWLCNWTRELDSKTATLLLAKVNETIANSGCVATSLGTNTVGVQGDARVYLPSVYITCPANMSSEDTGIIAAKIINEIPGISKVLVEIATN
jgi:hypothetical protein